VKDTNTLEDGIPFSVVIGNLEELDQNAGENDPKVNFRFAECMVSDDEEGGGARDDDDDDKGDDVGNDDEEDYHKVFNS
jgi:hypothetical protein